MSFAIRMHPGRAELKSKPDLRRYFGYRREVKTGLEFSLTGRDLSGLSRGPPPPHGF